MNGPPPSTTISLVVATVDRVEPLHRLLASVAAQGHPGTQVVLVDQNPDDVLAPVIARHRADLDITLVRSPRGLSRARNAGLAVATGDIIAFPDDDSWYPDGLLKRVVADLTANPGWDGITGRAISDDGQALGRWDDRPGPVNRQNVWTRGISFTIFLRRWVVQAVGGFDESLGVGAGTPWGSGEETDYLLRCIRGGAMVHYDPRITVGHPPPPQRFDAEERRKGRAYGGGFGRVLRLHGYPPATVARHVGRPFAGASLALLRGRVPEARYRLAIGTGRCRGWAARPGGR